jgi:hypothetical protein
MVARLKTGQKKEGRGKAPVKNDKMIDGRKDERVD